jgi:hypothetical protein
MAWNIDAAPGTGTCKARDRAYARAGGLGIDRARVLCVLQSLIARPRVPNLFPPYSLSLCALITVYQSLAEVDEDVSNKKSL